MSNLKPVGILLAAGRGARFDPAGLQDKLQQVLPHGEAVALASARHLLAVLPDVLAVVRPGADVLAQQLAGLGCRVTVCPSADQGMGCSLVHALGESATASAWVIALADMPYVQPGTIAALIGAIDDGADIALPVYQGRRGNPVAFSRTHLPRLLALGGEQGARSLLQTLPVWAIECDDPGILQDIDTPADLA